MSNYRVVIHGVMAGQSADAVAESLARFSKKTPQMLKALLLSRRNVLAKRTPDMQPALRYKQMLEKMGCACRIDAEITTSEDTDGNAAITSLTNLTMSQPNGTTGARDFQYKSTPIGMQLVEVLRIFRLKELIGMAVLASAFYYGWANNLFFR
jgi:hypothetical protein